MIIGFVIWSIVSAIMLGIGIWSYRSEKPVGFFTGTKPPEVKDAKKYNHAVGILWFIYAVLLELFGIPFLFLEQNSAGFIPVFLGTIAISIGLMVGYVIIEKNCCGCPVRQFIPGSRQLCHQWQFFFAKEIKSATLFLLKWSSVELIQLLPDRCI